MRQKHIVGTLAFAFLALGASPSHFWLDSGEITAAGADLGVMHPTGIPGLIPALHAATSVPLGTMGFRMALISSAFGAWAVALMFDMLRRRDVLPAIAWGAAFWAVVGLTFVRNGRVVEIYTLAAFLMMVVLWGFDPRVRAERRTGLRLAATMAATIAALGFGDLRLALGVPVFALWVLGIRRREAWARWAPLVVVLSVTAVASIAISSARGPVADWGDPETVVRLWDHLQARSIREAYASRVLPRDAGPWLHELSAAVTRLAEDLGPIGPACAVGGMLFWLRDRDDRGASVWVAFLVVAELFYVVGVNPMGGVDRQTGLPFALLAPMTLAIPLHGWALKYPRARWAVLPLFFAALSIPPILTSWKDRRLTASWGPHAWSRGALAELPPDALLITQTDDLASGILHARVVEGARPDVTCVPAQHLHKRPPDPEASNPALDRVWRAAATGHDEASRVEAVLADWEGPAALESPRVAILRDVDWSGTSGAPPVSLDLGPQVNETDVRRAVERWEGILETAEDRRRLAGALARHERLRMAREGTSRASLEKAAKTYVSILEEVLPEHVASMVALAAIEDALGDTGSALELTERALALEPDRPIALTNMALFLAKDPAHLQEAREYAERATWVRPDQARGWRRLEQVCAQMGDEVCAGRAQSRLEALVDAHEQAQGASH